MDRINWVTHECFQAVAQLARAHANESVEPAAAYARMRGFLEAAQRRAREAGYSEREQRQIGYALAALADEVAMEREGALRAHWATQTLQLALFGDNLAGERFFEELERAREMPPRIDVMRTYYLCLLFGFRGRYAVRGADAQLAELIESLRNQLKGALDAPEQLSPDGARPEHGFVDVTRRVPWPVLSLAAVVVSVVLYLSCKVALRDELAHFASLPQAEVQP